MAKAQTAPAPPRPVVADEDLPTFEVAERMAVNGTLVDMRESEVSDLLDAAKFPLEQELYPKGHKYAGTATGRMVSSMTTTWVHAAEPGRLHHVTQTLGWKPVLAKWLKPGTMSGAWAISPEGYLTRGEKGEDVACLMPRKYHLERMHKLAASRSDRARDISKIKQATAEDMAASGDERGAERVTKARWDVTFKESKGTGAEASAGELSRQITPESEIEQ